MAANVPLTDTNGAIMPDGTPLRAIFRIWSFIRSRIDISGFDFVFAILLSISTFIFHYNVKYWAGQVVVGNWQYGDAEFWWNGAIQFAEGILRDNPNLTFRMGYAVTAGLWVALFGTNFYVFHAILLALYVVAWYALYLVLLPSLGRIAAAVGILLTVLSPFTAEWLAISTSDSVGLLFNTWALVGLGAGMRNDLSPRWLAASGLFIAFSSLTRPLMTVFLVPALLFPAVAAHVDWRRRVRAMMAMLVAFSIPLFVWIAIFRSITGEWKLAGSDSSIFYAASDPRIQQWNNEMYVKVTELAKVRFNVAQPTTSQVNQEFSRLTTENYRRFAPHHLQRIVPHVVQIADMSVAKAARVEARTVWLRLLVVGVFALVLAIRLLLQRAVVRTFLVVSIIITWMYPPLTSWVVLLALVSVIPLALWNRSGWGSAVLTTYWCAGVVALYLVGGTWGPPLGPVTSVNALGYRLGSQFFLPLISWCSF